MMQLSIDLTQMNADNETRLREIAQRCPLDDGFGVYMARSALLKIDTLPKNYYNECELELPSLEGQRNKTNISDDEAVFNIYPNPTYGLLTIEYTLDSEDIGRVEVFDLSGRSIFGSPLNSGSLNTHINLKDLSSGLYMVKVEVNGENRLSELVSVLK